MIRTRKEMHAYIKQDMKRNLVSGGQKYGLIHDFYLLLISDIMSIGQIER